MLVKKVTYFGEFGYLNSPCIRRDKFMLLFQNSVKDVSVGLWPPCWCPSGWAPTWCPHTNLYKFG